MNPFLNAEQRQIQEAVRRVAVEKVAPRAMEIDRTAEYPEDMFELLRGLGWFALPFPPEYGGTGSTVSACVALEELVRVCYNTGYLLAVQWTPFGAILAGGTEAQKGRYLPGLASGELRGAISVTEPQSGSDVAGIKTRAKRVPGGYRLSGAKIWCTGAPFATGCSCPRRTASARTARVSRSSWRRSTWRARCMPRAASASRKGRSTMPRSTCRSAPPSGRRSPSSRACAGCSPTW
jgi:alkylation response protein AidB-like acyl-CoA dehydrogenase